MTREAKIKIVAVLVTIVVGIALLVWMTNSIRNALFGGMAAIEDTQTWVAPTVDPQTMYDQTAYEATMPTDPPANEEAALPEETLVTVPVDETAEELAREAAAG